MGHYRTMHWYCGTGYSWTGQRVKEYASVLGIIHFMEVCVRYCGIVCNIRGGVGYFGNL